MLGCGEDIRGDVVGRRVGKWRKYGERCGERCGKCLGVKVKSVAKCVRVWREV